MGRLTRDVIASFREGRRHKKLDRPFSDALVRQLDPDAAADLDAAADPGIHRDQIRRLCDEARSIDLDVSKLGPARTRSFVIWKLRKDHPELTEEALRALADYHAAEREEE